MIVAVTGHSDEAYVQKARDSGMNEVLIKPV
jgi:CheY-like chemotaxis protein